MHRHEAARVEHRGDRADRPEHLRREVAEHRAQRERGHGHDRGSVHRPGQRGDHLGVARRGGHQVDRAVHRRGEQVLDRPDVVEQRDPRPELPTGPEPATDAEPDQRQQPTEGAAALAQHDARAQVDHPHARRPARARSPPPTAARRSRRTWCRSARPRRARPRRGSRTRRSPTPAAAPAGRRRARRASGTAVRWCSARDDRTSRLRAVVSGREPGFTPARLMTASAPASARRGRDVRRPGPRRSASGPRVATADQDADVVTVAPEVGDESATR